MCAACTKGRCNILLQSAGREKEHPGFNQPIRILLASAVLSALVLIVPLTLGHFALPELTDMQTAQLADHQASGIVAGTTRKGQEQYDSRFTCKLGLYII